MSKKHPETWFERHSGATWGDAVMADGSATNQVQTQGIDPDYRGPKVDRAPLYYEPASVDGVLRVLRTEIEYLAGGSGCALHSEHAYTPSGNEHTVIQNGYFKGSGVQGALPRPLFEMAADTVKAAKNLRDRIGPKCQLVWRSLPKYDPISGNLSVRLCFEPI